MTSLQAALFLAVSGEFSIKYFMKILRTADPQSQSRILFGVAPSSGKEKETSNSQSNRTTATTFKPNPPRAKYVSAKNATSKISWRDSKAQQSLRLVKTPPKPSPDEPSASETIEDQSSSPEFSQIVSAAREPEAFRKSLTCAESAKDTGTANAKNAEGKPSILKNATPLTGLRANRVPLQEVGPFRRGRKNVPNVKEPDESQ
jgi:hypothetical protein